jgi:RNA polymerase sigma factor (sigma-70 family)
MDEKRKMKKSASLVQDIPAEVQDHPENQILLRQVLQELTPRYRSIIILKYFEDLTLKEIADIMGRPVGTIKTWLNKALKQMRLELGEEESWDV